MYLFASGDVVLDDGITSDTLMGCYGSLSCEGMLDELGKIPDKNQKIRQELADNKIPNQIKEIILNRLESYESLLNDFINDITKTQNGCRENQEKLSDELIYNRIACLNSLGKEQVLHIESEPQFLTIQTPDEITIISEKSQETIGYCEIDIVVKKYVPSMFNYESDIINFIKYNAGMKFANSLEETRKYLVGLPKITSDLNKIRNDWISIIQEYQNVLLGNWNVDGDRFLTKESAESIILRYNEVQKQYSDLFSKELAAQISRSKLSHQ